MFLLSLGSWDFMMLCYFAGITMDPSNKNSSLSILDCILFCWFPPLHFLCSLYLRTPIILDFGFFLSVTLILPYFSCFPSIFFFSLFGHFRNLIFHHSLSFPELFCFFIVFIVLFKKLIILFLLPVWYFYSQYFNWCVLRDYLLSWIVWCHVCLCLSSMKRASSDAW